MPELRTNPKGKQKRVYRWYATPWEILRPLPGLAQHLRPDVTLEQLAEQARRPNDLDAARSMQTAKQKLFASLRRKRTA